ncbi:MAG: hypothetical protein CMK09_02545 [Ponticaulis sp.]|nr:hypothetical protein [Ponticaulis sp.]|tara:strand:- start:45189 stop:45911 length:723 start_codon:yes stop_codon:yes gene_type:complete
MTDASENFADKAWTPFCHAVRFIADGSRFYSMEEAIVRDDLPTLEELKAEFTINPVQELVSMLHSGKIRACAALLQLSGEIPQASTIAGMLEENWISFVENVNWPHDDGLGLGKGPVHIEKVPENCWAVSLLHDRQSGIQLRVILANSSFSLSDILVRAEDLTKLSGKSGNSDRSEPKLSRPVASLLVAMAVNKYDWNVNDEKTSAFSRIESDARLNGTPVDLKTVRKWLREARDVLQRK